MVTSTLLVIAVVWILVALLDARRREILGWDTVESEFGGNCNVPLRYRGIVATEKQIRSDGGYWSMQNREVSFSTSRTAGRIYALFTGFLRAPFLVIGFVFWLCWQPFRPLVALVFVRPKSKRAEKPES